MVIDEKEMPKITRFFVAVVVILNSIPDAKAQSRAPSPAPQASHGKEKTMAKGIIITIIGAIGLIVGYSFRPPSNFGDAIVMMGLGREFFLREPIYIGLMVISGLIAVFGLVSAIKGTAKKED